MGKKTYTSKVTTKRWKNQRSYYADYRDADGRRRVVSMGIDGCRCTRARCKHMLFAEQTLAEFIVRYGAGRAPVDAVVPRHGVRSLPLADARAWYQLRTAGRAANTRASHAQTLDKLAAWGLRDIAALTGDGIVSFFSWFRRAGQKCAAATTNIHAKNLRAFLRALVAGGKLPTSPLTPDVWGAIIRPVTGRVNLLTDAEVERCLASSPCLERDVFELLWRTGMRSGEVQNLRWCDIVGGEIRLRCRADWSPKWRIERDIPVSQALAQLLDRLRADDQDAVYVVRRIERGWFSHRMRDWFDGLRLVGEAPGMPVTMHTIRHSFASVLVNRRGVPIPVAARLLGHRDLAMPPRYLHATTADARSAVESL